MNKAKLTLSALTTLLLTSGAYASPALLTLAEMDSVVGGAFVCPVIETDGVLHSVKSIEINGANSILGPTVGSGVQAHATNDDGDGSPFGTFVSPGSRSYTAIWN